MGNDVKGGQFILQQRTVRQEPKREFRSASLTPEEIRQFGANTAESAEMAKARRMKEMGQAVIKEMEAKKIIQETETEENPAKAVNKDETNAKEFDPNNLSFGAFLGN